MKRIENFATEIPCPECSGYRLKKEFLSLKISGKHIGEVSVLSVSDARDFFHTLLLSDTEKKIAE